MPRQPNAVAQPDPHDPLSPRPDDPRIGFWWARRLSRRPRSFTIVGMIVLLALVALGVVLLVRTL